MASVINAPLDDDDEHSIVRMYSSTAAVYTMIKVSQTLHNDTLAPLISHPSHCVEILTNVKAPWLDQLRIRELLRNTPRLLLLPPYAQLLRRQPPPRRLRRRISQNREECHIENTVTGWLIKEAHSAR